MQNAIIQKPGIGRVACNVLVAEGNNPKVLRPLGQLLKSLETARQQNGFHDALANRYLDGDIDVLFESGDKEKVQVRGVRCAHHLGCRQARARDFHINGTFTSTGLSPLSISLDVPLKLRQPGSIDAAAVDASGAPPMMPVHVQYAKAVQRRNRPRFVHPS